MITLKNQTIRNILIGKPTIMIKRGKIISNNLSQQKYNKADIMELLREKNVFKLSDVEMAVLETNGELTVQKQQQHEEHPSPDTQPTISYVKRPEKQCPMKQRKDLFQAIIKKCQADLELYALTTDSTTIKASVKKHIESLNELMENLQPFISKKKT
nr:YetF domain-containing protein [Heyndrickxia ginsengihumi]